MATRSCLKQWTIVALVGLGLTVAGIQPIRADSWIDPTWQWMLDSSDVVALIEYTSAGEFRAEANIVEVYRGAAAIGQKVWISGFSNRYGPIDEVKKGERFIAFLRKNSFKADDQAYWDERVRSGEAEAAYVDAIREGRAYWVSSPTSGDLKVKGRKVQYTMLQTTYFSGQSFWPLDQFHAFLAAYYSGTGKESLVTSMMSTLRSGIPSMEHAQALLMLELLQTCALDPSFDRFIGSSVPDVRYALARFAGCTKDPRREDILLALLKDEHSIVQGESVRQLAKLPTDRVGQALLAELPTANPGNFGPSDISDPVMNTVSGGRAQIIETLGDLKYDPAIPTLVALLENDDENTFELVVEALGKMNSRAHVPYMDRYLRSGKTDNVYYICREVVKDSLVECLPALMDFIRTHDRTVHPDRSVAVSVCCGLGHFRSDTISAFMLNDFQYLLDSVPSQSDQPIDNKKDWVEEYVNTFLAHRDSTFRKGLYSFMYDYYAFDHRFAQDIGLFALKKHIQDSIQDMVRKAFTLEEVQEVQVVVYLDDPAGQMTMVDYTVMVEVGAMDRLGPMADLYRERGFDPAHLWPRFKGNSHFHAKRRPEAFNDQLMRRFLGMITTFPTREDLAVLRAMKEQGYAHTNWERGELDKAIERISAAVE
jgi:hypothetical protein